MVHFSVSVDKCRESCSHEHSFVQRDVLTLKSPVLPFYAWLLSSQSLAITELSISWALPFLECHRNGITWHESLDSLSVREMHWGFMCMSQLLLPFCCSSIISLYNMPWFVYQLRDIWVVTSLGKLWIKLLFYLVIFESLHSLNIYLCCDGKTAF